MGEVLPGARSRLGCPSGGVRAPRGNGRAFLSNRSGLGSKGLGSWPEVFERVVFCVQLTKRRDQMGCPLVYNAGMSASNRLTRRLNTPNDGHIVCS